MSLLVLQFHPYALALLMGALLLLLVAAGLWRQRSAPADAPFLILILVQVLWLIAYALELASTSPEAVLTWYRVKFVAVFTLPTLWCVFVLAYARRTAWLRLPRLALLLAFAALSLLLTLTNDAHGLIWRSLSAVPQPPGFTVLRVLGPWLFLYVAHSLALVLVAAGVLVDLYRGASRTTRQRILLLLAAWVLPALAMLARLPGLPSARGLDLTPVALLLGTLLIALNTIGLGLFGPPAAACDWILASMTDGVIVLDAQNQITSINPAASALVQPLTLHSIGQSIDYVFKGMPEFLDRYRNTRNLHTEIMLPTGDGGAHHFELRISPLEQDGALAGRVIVLRDITQRVEAGSQLRILSRAVEQSGSTIFITDDRGVIEYVNPAFTAVTGYTGAEARGKTPRLVRSDRAPQEVYDHLWARLLAGEEWRGVFQNRKKNGDLYWAQSVISPVLNTRGEVTHYVAIQDDITEQRETAEQERQQRLLAEALRDNAEAMNSTLNLDEVLGHLLGNAGRAVFAPYDYAAILMVEEGEVRVAHTHASPAYAGPEGAALPFPPLEAAPTLLQVLESGATLFIPDTQTFPGGVDLPGAEWVRSLAAVPIRLEDDVIGLLALIARAPHVFDAGTVERLSAFTNQAAVAIRNAQSFATIQRYAHEVEARNRELDAFSHTVAHDLRSPLALVLGYLNLAQEDAEASPLLQSFIGEASRAATKMNDMIENLLLLAQLRNAQEVLRQEDLRVLAVAAAERFQMEITERGIDLSIAPDFPPVIGYGPWIEEVLANLISNAIKYIGQDNPAPCIQVRAVRSGGMVRCEVQDNGLGIAPENQAKLFEMFSRFHTGEARGFGIGLSIVLRIVDKLGGKVGVESAPGRGSTFWFTLPAAE